MNAKQREEIKDILEEESNVLAILIDYKTFKDMDHRVELAVRKEITRLRDLATCIKEIELR